MTAVIVADILVALLFIGSFAGAWFLLTLIKKGTSQHGRNH